MSGSHLKETEENQKCNWELPEKLVLWVKSVARFCCRANLTRFRPLSLSQGTTIARQIGAVAYVECTSKVSENSVRDVFHITTLASVRRPLKPQLKRSSSRRGLKRVSQLPLPPLPGRTEQMDQAPAMRKGRAKSCVLM